MKKQIIFLSTLVLIGQATRAMQTEETVKSALLRGYNALFSVEAVTKAPTSTALDGWNLAVNAVKGFVIANSGNVSYGTDFILDDTLATVEKANADLINALKVIYATSAKDREKFVTIFSTIEMNMKNVISNLEATTYYVAAKNKSKSVLLDLSDRIKNAAGRLRREISP